MELRSVDPPEPHDDPTLAQVIAKRVRELRARKGWSPADLADALTAEGIPVQRAAVTKLENDYRTAITINEIQTLAYVLDVSPLHLILPVDSGVHADLVTHEVTPNRWFSRHAIRDWWRGLRELDGQDRRMFLAERPLEELGSQAERKATNRRRSGGGR